MRLSACYIVKDETDELEQSLKSVSEAADEIIVVLTGDSTATAEVARKAGAVLYEFPWQNDFSLARNYALDKATGDWLICIDADEYFLYPEKVREAVVELLAEDEDADAVLIVRKEIYSVEGKDGMGAQLMARIFRNDRHLRYQGCIHEMMVWDDGHPMKFAYGDTRLTINHTGYEKERMPEKTLRNMELLEKDAAKNGKGLFHSFYLADCYFALGQYEKALQEALAVLKSDFTTVGFNGKCYHLAIECMRKLNLSLPGMLALAELAIVRLPGLPDFYGERGMILCAMGRLEEARCTFAKAIELYEAKAWEKSRESSFFSTQAAARVYHRMGELVLILDGDEPAAARLFAKAMEEDSTLPNVRSDYERYCQKRKMLSACYIVRNEGANLASSLSSLAGQVDEIIVVDTGSTDETIAIARKFGAKVFTVNWEEDFSAARNAALEKAEGEWILFLDADEYFSPETAANLRAFVQEQQGANLLMIYMRNIDSQSGESLLDFYAPRLFKRLPGVHYVGRIHEQLRLNDSLLEPVLFVEPMKLTLIHMGYSPEVSHKKAERNLKMLLAEIKASKTPELYYMYLAETYDGLEQSDKAMYYARLDIDSGKKNVSYASRSYKILLRILASRPARYKERLEIARRACQDFPDLPEFHADLAECLAYNLDFAEAVQEAEIAVHLFEDYHGVEPCLFTAEAVEILRHRQEVWQVVVKRMAEIKISACLIAVNEEHDLPGYLANAAGFVDEYVVVDGGSKDRTVDIARKADCHVVESPWQNDFAMARNTALDNAAGDWAVVMDADERVVNPEKVRPLLAFYDITRPDADALMVTIINIDEDDENRELYRFPYTRFVRLLPELRYEGRIHEQLRRSGGSVNLVQDDYRVQISHTGYSTRRIQRKLQRNLQLLQLEVKEHGMCSCHYRYFAEIYMGVGNAKLALQYALLAIEKGKNTIGTGGDMYYLAWKCMAAEEYTQSEQYAIAVKAIEQYPHMPEFWGIAGILDYDGNKWEKAGDNLRKAVMLWEQSEVDHPCSSSSFAGLADEVYWRLADIEAEAGNREKAQRYWQQGFHMNRHNVNLLNLYCKWHSQELPKELAGLVEDLYENNPQEFPFLSRFAENYGWMELYKLWVSKCNQNVPVIYDAAQTKNAHEFFRQDLLPSMVKLMMEVPAILVVLEKNPSLSARELTKKCAKRLPWEMYQVWLAYMGEDAVYSREMAERFLPAFRAWGGQEQISRMEALCAGKHND